jgi:SAM-dependent methyltransferase
MAINEEKLNKLAGQSDFGGASSAEQFGGTPMRSRSVPYVLGGTTLERDRLIAQARDLAPYTRYALERIGIGHGARTVDVGCGPIGITDLLSERVGPDGIVVGVEREPRFVDMARTELDRLALRNVRLVNADARDTGLERGSYDLVHERLVLINLPPSTQQSILEEMFSLVKPGGTILLQEYDALSYICYPPHPSWDALVATWYETFHAAGGNDFEGRTLAGLLRSAGVANIELSGYVRFPKIGEYQRTHLLSLVESLRDSILESGRMSDAELSAHVASLVDHLSDPATTVIDKLMVQAWGTKP